MKKHKFSTDKYNFRLLIEEFLAYKELEQIHTRDKFTKQLTSSDGEYGDQKQKIHRMFYDKLDEDLRFVELYNKFIKDIISPIFKEEIYYQKFPTFRVHQPDNICVFKWHRDKDFGHNEKEINFYMPITKAYDSNTIWVEKFVGAGKENSIPFNANYGELIEWDGASLFHGNQSNKTGASRISLDFRVLKKSDFDKNNIGKSLTRDNDFSPESYFTSISQ